MKKVFLLIAAIFGSLTLMAQPPQRPLPNQFRDFVDFKMSQERPQIEKKDGKVIITMSEEQFLHMKMMRQRNSHHVNFRQPMVCQSCKNCQKQQSKRFKGMERRFRRF